MSDAVASRELLSRSAPADGAANISRVRLSRHARHEMRLYGISVQDVEAAIAAPAHREVDERGNARSTAEVGAGRRILVAVAGDDPSFVITGFPRS